MFSSKLPSDPGLKVSFLQATIEDKPPKPKTSIFGRQFTDRRTGQPVMQKETIITVQNVFFELEDIPFFYLPYLRTNARDPLGPVNNIQMGYSHIFGLSLGVGFNVFKLLGIERPDGVRWRLDFDYLSSRGPAMATRAPTTGKTTYSGFPPRSMAWSAATSSTTPAPTSWAAPG